MLGPFWGLPWLCDPIEGGRWPYGVYGGVYGGFWGLPWLRDPIEGLRCTYGVYGASGGLNRISNPINGVMEQPHIQPH